MNESYLCPECRKILDPSTLTCPRNHRFFQRDGVLVLLRREFATHLQAFVDVLQDFRSREGLRILDESIYDKLPYAEAQAGNFRAEWRPRCHDLNVIRRLLRGRERQRVLDIGSYNGWLSAWLSRNGHEVTAVDFFADEHDGLGARKFYSRASWRSIQMDLGDLSILGARFDVVVLNRCLQFFPDPLAYLEHVKDRVAPGGLLILTGLDFYKNPSARQANLARLQERFQAQYGIDFFLRPTRGYLDLSDWKRLRAGGVIIRHYPAQWHRNIRSLLVPIRPRFCYGVCGVA